MLQVRRADQVVIAFRMSLFLNVGHRFVLTIRGSRANAQQLSYARRVLQDSLRRGAPPLSHRADGGEWHQLRSPGETLSATVGRTAGLAFGTLLLIPFSLILLVPASAVVIDSGVSILYRCQRPGQHGRSITVLKCRTIANQTSFTDHEPASRVGGQH